MAAESKVLDLECEYSVGNFQLSAQLSLQEMSVGIFGPSGAGKSTLLHLISGLLRPRRGRITLRGVPVFDSAQSINIPPEQRRIALVFQEGRLFPHLSVRGNLNYGFRLLSLDQRRVQPDDVIELLEISHLLSRQPRGLSGGERQRVALGRALLTSPQLLLLDEPLAALDAGLKGQLLPYFACIREQLDVPILYVSHSLSEIQQLARSWVIMENGNILTQGDTSEVFSDPGFLDLAARLGLESVLEGTVAEFDETHHVMRVHLNGQELLMPAQHQSPGDSIQVHIHPRDVILCSHRIQQISAQNQLSGRVYHLHPVRDRVLVTIDVGQLLRAEITAKAAEALDLRKGQEVVCLIKTLALDS